MSGNTRPDVLVQLDGQLQDLPDDQLDALIQRLDAERRRRAGGADKVGDYLKQRNKRADAEPNPLVSRFKN